MAERSELLLAYLDCKDGDILVLRALHGSELAAVRRHHGPPLAFAIGMRHWREGGILRIVEKSISPRLAKPGCHREPSSNRPFLMRRRAVPLAAS